MRAFAFPGGRLIYLAYLDEFGHVGPYVSRSHPRHNDSPVFGFAGFVMPAEEVRGFGTWFYQRKCELLDFEIRRSGKHPATWEKKGASLYRAANLTRYRQLRRTTNRLLGRIERSGGHVFYAGVRKRAQPDEHDANALYSAMLREAIRRLDTFCAERPGGAARFLLALDEHPRRAALLTAAARDMYGPDEPRRRLIEPPFHSGEPPLPDGAGGRLDRRPGGTSGRLLEGAGSLARERRLPPVLRVPADAHPDRKRHPRLTAPG